MENKSTSKGKVVILGTAWPLRGGLAAYNERLAHEFTAMGYETVIVGFSMQYPAILFPGKSQYSTMPKPTGLDIRSRVNSVNPLNWIRTAREIRKLNPDLLIIKFWLPFMAPCLGTIAGLVRRGRKTKVVSVVDNMIPHEKRPGDKLFSRYFVKRVHGFVAMSQSVLNDIGLFDQKKPKRLCMHPLYDHFGAITPAVQAQESLGLKLNARYVLFFGLIRDYKGLDILLEAMADPRLRSAGVTLLVAGEFYADPGPYHQLIADLALEEHVVLKTQFIPDDQVADWFNAADLVVQPYKSATQSGVTQIAYHFHKPMVVSNVGGLPEMVPHDVAGYVVEPKADEVADAIADFYSNKRAEPLVAGVIREKKKYSWEKMANTIIAVSRESGGTL
jgi:D-inositol-3-phosphate glycosyltransferase